MTSKPKAMKRPKHLKLILIIAGSILTFGWALLLAITTWLSDLPCVISPTSCADGVSLANFILYSPIIAGAFIFPIGFIYENKMSREAKFGITLVAAGLLFLIAFWLIVFTGISIHGLRG